MREYLQINREKEKSRDKRFYNKICKSNDQFSKFL